MEYNPSFKAMSGGEALTNIPEDILRNMSTNQKVCYKLVNGVKVGKLPPEMQDMLCGKISHAKWLTTGQGIIFLWTRKHGLRGIELKVLEMLVNFCLQRYSRSSLISKYNTSYLMSSYFSFAML